MESSIMTVAEAYRHQHSIWTAVEIDGVTMKVIYIRPADLTGDRYEVMVDLRGHNVIITLAGFYRVMRVSAKVWERL